MLPKSIRAMSLIPSLADDVRVGAVLPLSCNFGSTEVTSIFEMRKMAVVLKGILTLVFKGVDSGKVMVRVYFTRRPGF